MILGYVPTAVGQVHYRDSGSGDPIVLLHHNPRSSDLYRELTPQLIDRFRVVAIDTPGFGPSEKPASSPGIAGYADAVLAVVDALGLPPVTLFGFLTGASIAVAVSSRRPDAVRRLALGSCPDFEGNERERFLASSARTEPAHDGSHITLVWRGYAEGAYAGWGTADQIQRAVVDSLVAGARQAHYTHEAVAELDARAVLPTLPMPVLFVYSPRGPFAARQEKLARLCEDGRTEPIADSGPLIMQQRPAELAAILSRFTA